MTERAPGVVFGRPGMILDVTAVAVWGDDTVDGKAPGENGVKVLAVVTSARNALEGVGIAAECIDCMQVVVVGGDAKLPEVVRLVLCAAMRVDILELSGREPLVVKDLLVLLMVSCM
mmetsp:Transcript_123645/g.308985  ORF Transcript_123645/g.308985 Transcript_123645/m.308985 type:complete len:117 (+) Transcript_123645:465-815(+)